MAKEDLNDESRVQEGADALNDERLDSFMVYPDRQKVWDLVAHDMGPQWVTMSQQDRQKMIKRYTANIIIEVKTMAGGMWEKLSPEQKRALFRARFIEKTVVPAKRQEALEGTKKEQEAFPDMDIWLLKNRDFMFGMTQTERTAAYNMARSKWEKANKK